jgi:UDP-glucuronate decarboxylase
VTRILVTGGAGFLGSHLATRLLAAGNEVIVADDLSTGRRANLAGFANHPSFRFLEHDVTKPLDLSVDAIFHLACPASPVQYQRDRLRTLDICYVGTKNMLELAVTNRARFLLASTSEIYGEPLEHPQREDDWGHVNPNGERACYAEGKRVAEALAFDYARQRGAAIRVGRIFNTYGPRMAPDDGRVVSNFVVQALRGADLTVYGSGEQRRSFCYVDDLVGGLVLLHANDSSPGPINLGSPYEHTVREIAEMVLAKTGSKSRIVYGATPSDDPTRRKPDLSRAQSVLGWAPATGLDRGLDETIAYFRAELGVHS